MAAQDQRARVIDYVKSEKKIKDIVNCLLWFIYPESWICCFCLPCVLPLPPNIGTCVPAHSLYLFQDTHW